MARPVSRHPTELELEILKVLWQDSPLRVRDIRQALAKGRAWDGQKAEGSKGRGRKLAHTTVITVLNTMVAKGYLRRLRELNAYLYEPRITAEGTAGSMLHDLVDRVFDGSATAVMLNLLETADVDDEELKQLRRLLNRKAKEQST